jgi:hypothetical protein
MDLTGLPALDFAIGLSFVFLLLSVFASAIQEYIAGILNLRAKTLEKGLANMLEAFPEEAGQASEPAATAGEAVAAPMTDLKTRLYEHPLIRATYKMGLIRRSTKRLPSYISPRSFALAVLDTVAPDVRLTTENGVAREKRDVIADARQAIDGAGLPESVEKSLLGLLDDARGEIDEFRHNLEAWFDDTMARVSGWYKRKSQLILVVLGLGIALALNANTLTIGERLWKDPTVRTAVAQAGSQATSGEASADVQQAADDIDKVAALGVPLGWTSATEDPRFVGWPWHGEGWGEFLYHDVAGWLLTILAISFGAPFWFDTLSRFSRLRSSGKPEQPLPASAFGKPGERVGGTA